MESKLLISQKIVRNHKKLGSEINSVHDHNHNHSGKSKSKSTNKSKHSHLKQHGSCHRPKLSDAAGDFAIPLSKNHRNMTTVEINEIHEWCLGRSKSMLRKFSPNIADAGYNSINSVNINQIDRKRSTSQKIGSRANIDINRSAKTMISKDKDKDDEKNGFRSRR